MKTVTPSSTPIPVKIGTMNQQQIFPKSPSHAPSLHGKQKPQMGYPPMHRDHMSEYPINTETLTTPYVQYWMSGTTRPIGPLNMKGNERQ